MILDQTLRGVLDQGRGCLLIFDDPEETGTYGAAIDMLEQIGNVVESLYAKVILISSPRLDYPLNFCIDY